MQTLSVQFGDTTSTKCRQYQYNTDTTSTICRQCQYNTDITSTICRHFQYNTDTTSTICRQYRHHQYNIQTPPVQYSDTISTICRHNTIWFLYTILKYIQQIVETSFSIQHTIHNINTTSIIRSGHKWENWCRRWQRNTSNWYKLHTVTDNHKWLTPDWDHRRRPTTKWSNLARKVKMLHTTRQQPTSSKQTTK